MTHPRPRFQGLFTELKRRRVFRATAVYAVVAIGVVEVANNFFPPLQLPPWTITLVVAMAILGLPVTIALSWAFDVRLSDTVGESPEPAAIAPAPAKRDTTAQPEGPRGSPSIRWTPGRIAVLGAVVVLAIAGGAFVATLWRDVGTEASPRVVVAVFENHTGDEALAPLGPMAADWVTQRLIDAGFVEVADAQTALAIAGAQASTRDVVPPTVLAREARASLVVRGSYYLSGDSVYIRADVVDDQGRLLESLPPAAAHRDDRLGAVEALYPRVVTALALRVDTTPADFDLAPARPPSWEAYLAYLDGQRAFLAENFSASQHAFDRAIALDSTFDGALLWSGFMHRWWGSMDSTDARIAQLERRRARLSEYDRARLAWLRVTRSEGLEDYYQASRAVVSAAPGSVNARRELAIAALRTRRYAEARQLFDALYPFTGLMRSWQEGYLFYADLLHLQGDHGREADVALDWARDGTLELRLTRLVRARAAAGAGEAERAVALADSASTGSRVPTSGTCCWHGNGDVELFIGQELVGHGATAQGQALIARAIARLERAAPESPEALAHLAIAYYAAGQYDDARSTMDRIPYADDLYAWLTEYGQWGQGIVPFAYRARLIAREGDVDGAFEILDVDYAYGHWVWRMFVEGDARAPIEAMRGERERALGILSRSPDLVLADGHGMRIHNSADPDLASLRGWAPFEALVRGERPR